MSDLIVVAFDDEAAEALATALAGLPGGSAVHVVALSEGGPATPGVRDDAHPLAAVVRRHNGAVWRFDPSGAHCGSSRFEFQCTAS